MLQERIKAEENNKDVSLGHSNMLMTLSNQLMTLMSEVRSGVGEMREINFSNSNNGQTGKNNDKDRGNR